jgi:hypothetical protein
MHRHVRIPLLCTSALLLLAATSAPLKLQAASELERQLRDQYNGKILVLRNFYHGDHLTYDSSGIPAGSPVPGDWTVDGFARLTNLDLSGHRLTIHAVRLSLGNTGKSFQFEEYFDKNKRKDKDEEEKAEREHRLRRCRAFQDFSDRTGSLCRARA